MVDDRTVEVDTTTPVQPGLPSVTDNVGLVTGPVSSGSTIDDALPVISGKADAQEAGDFVTIYVDGAAIGQARIEAGGWWRFRPDNAL